MKNKMLYITIIGLAIISIFITYKYINLLNRDTEDTNEVSYPLIYDYLDSLTIGNFEDRVEYDDIVIYFGRPTCLDCNLFDDKFISLIQEKTLGGKIYYLNVESIHKEKSAWNDFKEKYNISGTPSIVHYSKGSVIDKVEWNSEKGISIEEVASWLERNGLN